MSKHTSGPWTVRNIASKDAYVGPAADGGAPNVAIIPKRITRSNDEQQANARLIAAAPELLEALQQALPQLIGRAYLDARAAIAKATGEAQ